MVLKKDCKQQKRVLILSAPIGSGHNRAASAIKEQFLQQEDVCITTGNVFDFCPKFFGSMLLNSYFGLLRRFPYGYVLLYKWGDQSNSWLFRYFVNWLFTIRAYDFIDKVKPDIVIATHVTPAGIIAQYKEKYNKNLPLFGIVTDYSMHKWWLYKEINAYIIADKSIFSDYLSSLVEGQKLWDCGIPVHEKFNNDFVEKSSLKDKLNVPEDVFICLLTGGGEGLLPMDEILQAWQGDFAQTENIFFVVVCGKNEQLKKRIDSFQLPYVKAFGYVDNIDEYMKVADILVSKAGGVTVTEAIACNLPIMLFKPLPGQEFVNTKYLLANKLVTMANNVQQVCKKLSDFANNKNEDLIEIKNQQKNLAKKQASKCIVEKIYDYLHLS